MRVTETSRNMCMLSVTIRSPSFGWIRCGFKKAEDSLARSFDG
jgi:hypothetical protein